MKSKDRPPVLTKPTQLHLDVTCFRCCIRLVTPREDSYPLAADPSHHRTSGIIFVCVGHVSFGLNSLFGGCHEPPDRTLHLSNGVRCGGSPADLADSYLDIATPPSASRRFRRGSQMCLLHLTVRKWSTAPRSSVRRSSDCLPLLALCAACCLTSRSID